MGSRPDADGVADGVASMSNRRSSRSAVEGSVSVERRIAVGGVVLGRVGDVDGAGGRRLRGRVGGLGGGIVLLGRVRDRFHRRPGGGVGRGPVGAGPRPRELAREFVGVRVGRGVGFGGSQPAPGAVAVPLAALSVDDAGEGEEQEGPEEGAREGCAYRSCVFE